MLHRLAPRARADLEEIWLYVVRETGSDAIADRQVDELTRRFVLLAEHPRLGRSRDDDLGRGRRSLSVGDYLIVYRIAGVEVQVLRIVHGRRHLEALFGP